MCRMIPAALFFNYKFHYNFNSVFYFDKFSLNFCYNQYSIYIYILIVFNKLVWLSGRRHQEWNTFLKRHKWDIYDLSAVNNVQRYFQLATDIANKPSAKKLYLPLWLDISRRLGFFSLTNPISDQTLFLLALTRGNNAIHYLKKATLAPKYAIRNAGRTPNIRQKIIAFVLIHTFPCSTSREFELDCCCWEKKL